MSYVVTIIITLIWHIFFFFWSPIHFHVTPFCQLSYIYICIGSTSKKQIAWVYWIDIGAQMLFNLFDHIYVHVCICVWVWVYATCTIINMLIRFQWCINIHSHSLFAHFDAFQAQKVLYDTVFHTKFNDNINNKSRNKYVSKIMITMLQIYEQISLLLLGYSYKMSQFVFFPWSLFLSLFLSSSLLYISDSTAVVVFIPIPLKRRDNVDAAIAIGWMVSMLVKETEWFPEAKRI